MSSGTWVTSEHAKAEHSSQGSKSRTQQVAVQRGGDELRLLESSRQPWGWALALPLPNCALAQGTWPWPSGAQRLQSGGNRQAPLTRLLQGFDGIWNTVSTRQTQGELLQLWWGPLVTSLFNYTRNIPELRKEPARWIQTIMKRRLQGRS